MTAARSSALGVGVIALLLLAILQIAWHAWLAPPPAARFWPTLAVAVLPLLPALWTSMRNARRGLVIGGMVCLFYFCHGVATVYGDADVRVQAFAEIALSLLVICASGWDARGYKRKRSD